MLRKPPVGPLIFLILCVPAAHAQSAPVKTVLDGVYSDAQAERGHASYTQFCGSCHGAGLEGISAPALTGDRFLERWREGVLESLYNFIRLGMPPRNGNAMPEHDYLDLVTYLLKMNGYATGGSELTSDGLASVLLVGKNGPRPVPDGSLIMTAGCLSQTPNGAWILFNATEPVRSRTETASTPSELRTSAEKSRGALMFRLEDLEAIPDFAPDSHKGHKMHVKGFLTRQPNAERISLLSVEMLDSACWP